MLTAIFYNYQFYLLSIFGGIWTQINGLSGFQGMTMGQQPISCHFNNRAFNYPIVNILHLYFIENSNKWEKYRKRNEIKMVKVGEKIKLRL